jgi:hypothetical protein
VDSACRSPDSSWRSCDGLDLSRFPGGPPDRDYANMLEVIRRYSDMPVPWRALVGTAGVSPGAPPIWRMASHSLRLPRRGRPLRGPLSAEGVGVGEAATRIVAHSVTPAAPKRRSRTRIATPR